MIVREKIYVSMTSWYQRIGNVSHVLKTLLNQTLQPYKIIVNLCIQDFPNMEEDLPQELLDIIGDESNQVELYWFIENYKAWKKHLHTLDIVGDDDLIISTDDDHLYPPDFVEKMYVSYCFYGKKFPVTLNKIFLAHNLWCFNGPGTLYRKSDFGKDYKKYLTYDILHNCMEDTFISILLGINKTIAMPEIFHVPKDADMLFNDSSAWTDRNSMRRTGDNEAPVNDLYKSTIQSIIDTCKINYFKENKAGFTPNFWRISNDVVDYVSSTYGHLYPSIKFLGDNKIENPLKANVWIDFKKLGLDIERHNKEYYIGNDNLLVVSLSSWPGRINNVHKILSDMLYQTMPPDKIVLNLAKPDFGIEPSQGVDLNELANAGKFPKNLLDLIYNNGCIEIAWHNKSEYKSWKKHLYVAERFSDNDVIVAIDDDVLYKETFLETMVKSYYEYGKTHAISCGREFCQGGFAVYGYALLYTPDFMNIKNKQIFPEHIFEMFPEDNHILNVLSYNKHSVMPVIGYNYLFYSLSFNETDSNFGNNVYDDAWWETYIKLSNESSKILAEAGKTRPEMEYGWNPKYFNFTIGELIQFTKDTNYENAPKHIQAVYNAINMYLEKQANKNIAFAMLKKELDTVIL